MIQNQFLYEQNNIIFILGYTDVYIARYLINNKLTLFYRSSKTFLSSLTKCNPIRPSFILLSNAIHF